MTPSTVVRHNAALRALREALVGARTKVRIAELVHVVLRRLSRARRRSVLSLVARADVSLNVARHPLAESRNQILLVWRIALCPRDQRFALPLLALLLGAFSLLLRDRGNVQRVQAASRGRNRQQFVLLGAKRPSCLVRRRLEEAKVLFARAAARRSGARRFGVHRIESGYFLLLLLLHCLRALRQ